MNIEEIAQELQKFIDAHDMGIDATELLDEIDAGDFVSLNQAIDKSDNRTIMQILQKYKSKMSENYNKFSKNSILESDSLIEQIDNMCLSELTEIYKSNVQGALSDCYHLTLQELKTLVYESILYLNEDITSTLSTDQLSNQNGTQNSQNYSDPQTQDKVKQADLLRNATNSSFKVSVPSSSGTSDQISSLVGVDVGSTPEQTLVVTKDPTKQNQVNVFGLGDVNPVEESEDEEIDSSESPLTNQNPSMGELYKTIGDIETSNFDTSGKESPEGNSAMENEDDMLQRIMDFCSKTRGR